MAPAFGLVEAKGLVPCFMDIVSKARKICWYSLKLEG